MSITNQLASTLTRLSANIKEAANADAAAYEDKLSKSKALKEIPGTEEFVAEIQYAARAQKREFAADLERIEDAIRMLHEARGVLENAKYIK